MQKTVSAISLRAIRHNAEYVRSLIGERFFFAVVKADAYGHGATEVAREIEDLADGFCVAIADEGIALRIAGITKPVLVFAPPLDEDDALRMNHYNLQATVADKNSAKLCKGLTFHIAVNTGMNRYGCSAGDVNNLLDILPEEGLAGVYSHLYCPADPHILNEQLELFRVAAAAVKAKNPAAIAHIAASAGTLAGGECLMDGARCGIMLYGYPPQGFYADGLEPALKVYARLAQRVKPSGGGVGYNAADKTYKNLFTYRLGYADGFSRNFPLGEKTLCMDAFISEEERELLPVLTDAADYAKALGTIPYEVLCSVTRRSLKVYER